jgi:hypothetical protein
MAVPNDFIQYLQGLSDQEKKDAYREIFQVLGPATTVTDENLRMAYKEYGDEMRHFSTVRSALTTFLVTVMLGALSVFFNKSQSHPFLVAAALILGLAAVVICLEFSRRTSHAYLRRKRIWEHFAKGLAVDRLEDRDFPSAPLTLKVMIGDITNTFLVVGLLLIALAFHYRDALKGFLPELLDPPPASNVLLHDILLFDPNEARVDQKATQAIQKIKEVTLKNPDSIVLLSSHADTTGASPRNQQLARLRSIAVRERLVAGGVASNRIFASDLATDSLPVITPPKAAEPWNRAVAVEVRRAQP